ncbi:MAG: ECF transporter S component [Actinomycetes bacterium]
MSEPSLTDQTTHHPRVRQRHRWRTVDIVVTATLGVAFGVVFWAWGLLWNGTAAAFAVLPPAQGLLYGVWFVPGVLAGLVVRRPGAAVLAAFTAALVSALLGSTWGTTALVYGVAQGLAPEAVFALFRYRRFGLVVSVTAATVTGVVAATMDLVTYYPTWSSGWKLLYVVTVCASGAVVAGVGSWALARTMARAGVLSAFPSGADQARV